MLVATRTSPFRGRYKRAPSPIDSSTRPPTEIPTALLVQPPLRLSPSTTFCLAPSTILDSSPSLLMALKWRLPMQNLFRVRTRLIPQSHLKTNFRPTSNRLILGDRINVISLICSISCRSDVGLVSLTKLFIYLFISDIYTRRNISPIWWSSMRPVW